MDYINVMASIDMMIMHLTEAKSCLAAAQQMNHLKTGDYHFSSDQLAHMESWEEVQNNSVIKELNYVIKQLNELS